MSRCFPFPPPGYEKRARIDDTDLLKKEKQKEKRNKKVKKDKEKREGKEKKDKERSKEKLSDKKDRKEKKKDKDRDRDRDKEKNRTSDEKRVAGQPDSFKGEKLVPNNLQNVEVKDAKFVQELARRIRDEERATKSQMVQKITVTGQRGSEFLGTVVGSNLANCSGEQRKIKDAKEDGRQINGQTNHINAKSLESAIGGNFSIMDRRRVGLALPVEKDVEKPKDGKAKNKHKESDGKGDKPKDSDREKKIKSKVKDEAKEKKKVEKAKEISEQSKQQPKLQENGRESLDTCNAKQFYRSGMSNNSTFGEGNLGKRKELHKNGPLLDNGLRPHKLLRPVSSSEPVMENGRKLEPCQTDIASTSGRQGAAGNGIVDIKEHRLNGLVGPQRPNACSMRSSSTIIPVNENGEASAKPPLVRPQRPNANAARSSSTTLQVNDNGEAFSKPPHPDSKYLIQILSIPKVEELSDIDDQEWLFSSNCLQSKKSKAGSPRVEGTQHVWAEAFQIESADVYALPYVIPY
ncbi:DEAD-box ATP-dependent RNA helicase 42 isoform X3 [Alnus glutinosa]|uniref:DEAD-box ATP-dependent RNA helicase 42 isoform X3 n=1 Tax=Alnus glutinosa TaxID=3517 RepID=UPI002D7899A9|nr:DEAD-box ATP-dependent RNA helicase 42 isoform X3 [Alnus glutinosa]